MATYLLDQKKLINDNIFLYEQRLNSQYTRFLDKSPLFVKYFSISNLETSADLGFQTVDRILGPSSPIKFKEIKDLPMYGIEQILLDLSAEDQGLDTDYEGEGIMLPNTVKPVPNDFFMINHLDKNYLFMVNKIAYDTIKSNNFYKVTFNVRSLDGQEVLWLNEQVTEKYSCIFTNIGTKDKCLIKDDEIDLILKLDNTYTKIADRYKMFFYDKKFNAFMFTADMTMFPDRYYDRYLSYFINDHQLFNKKNDYETFYLTTERMDHHFILEYHDSFYKSVEDTSKRHLTEFKFDKLTIIDITSIFSLYRDFKVKDIKLGSGNSFYVPMDLVTRIMNNNTLDSDTIVWETIIKFFNNELTTIYNLKLNKLEDYHSYFAYDFESYVLMPILLYIIRLSYLSFMSAK